MTSLLLGIKSKFLTIGKKPCLTQSLPFACPRPTSDTALLPLKLCALEVLSALTTQAGSVLTPGFQQSLFLLRRAPFLSPCMTDTPSHHSGLSQNHFSPRVPSTHHHIQLYFTLLTTPASLPLEFSLLLCLYFV